VFTKVNLTLSPIHAVSTPQLAREAFYSAGIAEESLTRYHAQIQNDSFRAYLDMMLFSLPRPALVKTPMLVLGAEDDAMFTVDEIRATARAYGTEADILPGVAHNMMLEPGWRSVADRIVSWLRESGI
jgi:alpha-beta hydrolase superfamily lysophospholipase